MIPIAYNVRSLAVRRRTTVATALGFALVVFVFSGVLMFSDGLRHTLGKSAAPRRVMVLRKGAGTEVSSQFDERQLNIVHTSEQLARGADGSPRAMNSLVVSATLDAMGSGVSNILIRGISGGEFSDRPGVALVAGRWPQPGADEGVVGEAVRGRLRGLEIDGTVELPRARKLKVVGVVSHGGSSFDSEVWTHADVVQGAYGLESHMSSASFELSSDDAFDAFKRSVEDNPQLGLQVQREVEFYERQAGGMNALIRMMALLLAVLFSVAATLGAAITMHAAVANRQRELGVLRALGFTRSGVVASMLLESTILAVAGGLLGACGAVALKFVKFAMVNQATRGMIVFSFMPSIGTISIALAVSLAMGLLGGFFPALRASRVSPAIAMRQ